MFYPTISEYIEAIKSAEDNFEELSYLRPVLGDDGLPVMTSGNFAVVFKMKDERDGKLYAVKCFTKEQKGRAEAYRQITEELKDVDSPYLVSVRYLDKELFVDTGQTTETEFPVLLMDWVEGKTLDKYLRENLYDKYALEMLAYRFSLLAQWLIPQPFAHGDLKPDNILVRENGSLVLVDYDGMYVPAMKGQKAREIGSPDFRHPLRTENDFNENIDEFSFLSLLLSLKAISINTALLDKYSASPRLLFSEQDYLDINNSKVLKELFPSSDNDVNKLTIAFLHYILNSTNDRYPIISILNSGYCPDITRYKDHYDNLSNKYIDEFGVEYTHDKKILLSWRNYLSPEKDFPASYNVCEGTRIICDEAFMGCKNLTTIGLPKSLRFIGDKVFEWTKLSRIRCDSSMFVVENNILYSYDKRVLYYYPEDLKDSYFEVPDYVKIIAKGCFKDHKYLWVVKLNHILYDFFDLTSSNRYISIPKGTMKYINMDDLIDHLEYEFKLRNNIFEGDIIVDNGVVYSSDKAVLLRFPYWLDYEEYYIDEKCKIIGAFAFDDSLGFNQYGEHILFNKLKSLYLPNGLEEIRDYAFVGCGRLENLTIPSSVRRIGNYVFGQCVNLTTLTFLSNIEIIGKESFYVGRTLGNLVDPYFPFVSRGDKKCEVDLLICPIGTEEYYRGLLENENSQILTISKNEMQIKSDVQNRFSMNSFLKLFKPQFLLSEQEKKELSDIVIDISDNDYYWGKAFGIDFSKLKKLMTNTNAIFNIGKSTNRFYGVRDLSGICYVTKNYQTKYIGYNISFASYDDAFNYVCRVYFEL